MNNKQGMHEVLFIHAHVTLEYFNFKRENGFKKVCCLLLLLQR